jgi:hypothetical protein
MAGLPWSTWTIRWIHPSCLDQTCFCSAGPFPHPKRTQPAATALEPSHAVYLHGDRNVFEPRNAPESQFPFKNSFSVRPLHPYSSSGRGQKKTPKYLFARQQTSAWWSAALLPWVSVHACGLLAELKKRFTKNEGLMTPLKPCNRFFELNDAVIRARSSIAAVSNEWFAVALAVESMWSKGMMSGVKQENSWGL